jgi:lipoate---protein ligase
MWSQTPQFTLSLQDHSNQVDLEMNIRHGIIEYLEANDVQDFEMLEQLRASLIGQKLQDVGNWHDFLRHHSRLRPDTCTVLAGHLEGLLPTPHLLNI